MIQLSPRAVQTRYLWLSAALILAAAALLFAMGRTPWCTCGYVKLWHGVVNSSENSQHIADWYSFTHIIHGFIFYFLLRLIAPRSSLGLRLLLAVAVESAWEVFENTDFIINRYRAVTTSLDYYGDSVINAAGDIVFMVFGFFIAARFPVWLTVVLALGIEIGLAFAIRDNLVLNILMLVWPLEPIRQWQSGG